ncbi:TetR/AcrR family transcriptional regulator [Arthrobacter sp. LAPM80]|uniref:TetR/AcrR family transcriptional regulator n=1 Tax=Arthrobacter sp. LAPM80 TaxID=3141788 RepID=UPI00398B83E1
MPRPSAVAERRHEILKATCLVISERGFRDLRIADVAKIAGYSTGTVHYYFDSKDELLVEAFRFQYEQSVGRREYYFQDDDDPVLRLRKLARGYLPSSESTIQAWRVWLELWVSALRDRPLAALNDVYYGDWRNAVLEAATAARDEGLLNISDVVAFADVYVAMLDGLAIQVLIGATHMTVQRMQETCTSFIDNFLVP